MTTSKLAALEARVRELLQQQQHKVDFLAVRLEQSEGTNIVLRSGKVETLSTGTSIGGQIRACYKGGWGFASFNDLETLPQKLAQTIEAARWLGQGETHLAPLEPVQAEVQLTPPNGNITLARKLELCQHYDSLLLQPQISSTTVRYGDSRQTVLILTSEGTSIKQSWCDWEMRFAATARDGEQVQTARETIGSRHSFSDLVNYDAAVVRCAQRAREALQLPMIQGGTYTVVIDPILAGLFVHEAFGHLSEADMVYENPEMLEVMTIGRKFGCDELQIFDGAAPLGDGKIHRGSYAYDDEGVPATVTQLIQDGVLVGRLHSRETAGKLGEQPTGNARCLDYHYPPIVRMTNTWIGRGKTPVADLLNDIPLGVYAANWKGGMTNGEMFTFTAGEAWMIRNGKLAEPVRDVTLSGNVFQTLADIEAIGDDFHWDESGGCGKGGQNGLAVGCGAPSLRIRNVVIGGTAA
ncbi:MAG: TldD/PmbA family protein [Pseudanabaenaceae cyanobacterium]